MIAETKLTISGLQARAVNVELERPVQTSAGEITSAALVLIDLETREGTTGRAYIRSYTTIVLEPLRRLVENLGKTLEGDTLAPQEIERKLQVSCSGCSDRRASPASRPRVGTVGHLLLSRLDVASQEHVSKRLPSSNDPQPRKPDLPAKYIR
jgi:hypothetical protein